LNFASPIEFSIDSATMLRAELPVQRNSTLNTRGDAAMTTDYTQQLDFSAEASAGAQQAPWVPQAWGTVSLPYTGTLPSE
jgi:hypothetical protein